MSKKTRTSNLAFLKSFGSSILAFLIIPVILLVLWQGPQWLLSYKKISTPDKQAELENAYRATLVQALGSVFFFVTAWLTWRNVKVAEEKQVTERFSKAIELLGSDKLEVRLGGIYALERIAKDSPKDHWTIMEVLTSFIQANSTLSLEEPQKITADVQGAVSVIRRRDSSKEPEDQKLDLSDTNLYKANLSGTDLSGANLSHSNLERADLSGTNLNGALLYKANLIGTRFDEANLKGAVLLGAYCGKTLLSATAFRKTKGLDLDQVKEAEHWEQAIYEEDFRKQLGLSPKSEAEKQEG